MAAGERHPHPTYPALTVFKRTPTSRHYSAEAYFNGHKWRRPLKTDRLTTAFKLAAEKFKEQQRATVAEDTKRKFTRLSETPTIGELFVSWRATLPSGKRPYHDTKWGAVGPFWRGIVVTDITPQLFRDYFLQRRRVTTQYGEPPTNGTLHKDVMLLRQILKHAVEEAHLQQLPTIPHPGEIATNPRPWLTEKEWADLRDVSMLRIQHAANSRLASRRSDTDHFMRFMVDSMCRVDELRDLRFRDCQIETNTQKQQKLLAQVTGKRGTRDIVAGADAASIYAVRLKRAKGDLDALIFNGQHHRDSFRELLKAAKLHRDAQGFARNFKSLRATSISFAVLDGGKQANLMMIARNAGTSVTMIDTFYSKRLTAQLWKDELGASDRARKYVASRSTSLRRKKQTT